MNMCRDIGIGIGWPTWVRLLPFHGDWDLMLQLYTRFVENGQAVSLNDACPAAPVTASSDPTPPPPGPCVEWTRMEEERAALCRTCP